VAGGPLTTIPPAPRRGTHPLGWLARWLAVLTAGLLVLRLGNTLLLVAVFPALHVLAALLPAVTVASYAAWRAGWPAWLTWRGIGLQIAWGCLAATALALAIELAAVAVLAGGVYIVLQGTGQDQVVVEGARAVLRTVSQVGAQGAGGDGAPLDPAILKALTHPLVLSATFGLVAVIGPLAEELAKLLGVALRRPTRASEAWVWGVSAGAGFGIIEAVLFGALGLDAGAWLTSMLARACATLMHATMTGLAGLGWRARGGWRLVALAIVGHGLWNTLVLVAVVAAVVGGARGDEPLLAAASAATMGVVGVFAGVLLGFVWLSRAAGVEDATADPAV